MQNAADGMRYALQVVDEVMDERGEGPAINRLDGAKKFGAVSALITVRKKLVAALEMEDEEARREAEEA